MNLMKGYGSSEGHEEVGFKFAKVTYISWYISNMCRGEGREVLLTHSGSQLLTEWELQGIVNLNYSSQNYLIAIVQILVPSMMKKLDRSVNVYRQMHTGHAWAWEMKYLYFHQGHILRF
jgi:hypothetical protein